VTDGLLTTRPDRCEGVEDLSAHGHIRRRAGRAGCLACGSRGPRSRDQLLRHRQRLRGVADLRPAGRAIQQVERSLRQLGTDYIDLYYAHFPDPDTPLEQTLLVYDDLVRQGKLRYVALSNHPAWQVTHALWIADDRGLAAAPACVQVKYNGEFTATSVSAGPDSPKQSSGSAVPSSG
jgi:hypothetical protein